MGEFNVKPKSLRWLFPVKGIKQCCGTEEKTAGSPGGGVTMVGLHKSVDADMVHYIQG
jgi:hypothetical protein